MSAHYTENARQPGSYYSASRRYELSCPALLEDMEADVCVIGGGYTGLSCALALAHSGCQVALLEAQQIAWGASGRNGGHVGVGQRRTQEALQGLYGTEVARKLWQCGLDAVDLVKTLITRHQIDCDLQSGILHVAHKRRYTEALAAEAEYLQRHYGYREATAVSEEEVAELLDSRAFYGGMRDSGSMHLHPLNYALGLAKAALEAGVRIFEESSVTGYRRDAEHTLVTTEKGHRVRARNLVLACNGYLGNLEPRISGAIMPINNFMVATEPLGAEVASTLISQRLAVQDSRFVINYWRCSDDHRLIFGGGESYRSTLPRDIAAIVKKRIVAIYPQLADVSVDHAWGGTLAITMDRMPHVGRLDGNIYYAHGYSGHGVPTATLVGKAIADAISSHRDTFELFASLPVHKFPGGTLLRWPAMVAGMLYYSTLDKF